MEQIPNPVGVYIRIDARGNVVEINSNRFLTDTSTWLQIDAGYGDRYTHAQGNYLPGPISTDEGIPRYHWDGDTVAERAPEEIAADLATIPPPPVSETEKLRQQLEMQDAVLQELLFSVIPMLLQGGEL